MLDPVPQHLNSLNLIEVSELLDDIEHFIFFGTLLGITRQGEIIPNDDDIDIYVEQSERNKLIKLLKHNQFIIDESLDVNLSKHFFQLKIIRDNIPTYVDFYFYDKSKKDFISEKWNFSGKINDHYNEMLIQKNLIFPLQKIKYKNIWLSLPAKPKEVCLFLYGKNWKTPLKKRTQYFTVIFSNKPVILQGLSGRIIEKFIKKNHSIKNIIRKIFL